MIIRAGSFQQAIFISIYFRHLIGEPGLIAVDHLSPMD